MIVPAVPHDEAHRLNTLRSMRILDTPPEERFDRYTRLAKRLFDVPIALFSLVDRDRQWFKSRQGLEALETPRDISFCGHAILDDHALVVNDALQDERFADNPLVTEEPRIRFYAGQPIRARNGARVGTLCLIDRIPRQLLAEDLKLLQDLGRLVEDDIASLELATIDSLTGLSNRRGFEILSHQAFESCRRQQRPVTLLVFDLDYFKAINDKLGHAEGDKVLREFANCLSTTFRESDVIGRTGGDEFSALLCDACGETVEPLLVRLRQTIAKRRDPDCPYNLSFSVGGANGPARGAATLDSLARDADAAMYRHKRSSRRLSGV